jgi:hypothetical protein
MARRQKAAPPQTIIKGLVARIPGPERNHDDESGERFVFAAEPVRDPRAEARPAGKLKTGQRRGDRRIVVDLLGIHRLDETDVIDVERDVRQQLA